MPPSVRESDDWISSERLPTIPHEDLLLTEVDEFLEYLFSTIGRRPRPIGLREGASVARYLKSLAWETAAGPSRQRLERTSNAIWDTVFSHARFSISSKTEAMVFLAEHADTYLAGLDVEGALKQVRESRVPRLYPRGMPLPNLLSRNMSVQGQPTPHRRDDLSERIYAGYHALRRARVRNARGRLAEALNKRPHWQRS
jgi:hypothetical protein